MNKGTSRFALIALLLAGSVLASACGTGLDGGGMGGDANFDTAWEAVRAAESTDAQRQRIDAFLAMNQQAGAPPLMVSVARRDTGEKAAIDQALWDNPQDYEVTLRYDERRYRFVPLGRASLEPLFRE